MNQENNTNRRRVLKGVGIGALGLPLVTNTAAAQQASCSLTVSVEAGEGDEENWTPRDQITDNFRGKISVSGVQSGSEIAYMIVPTNPEEGGFLDNVIRSGVVEAKSSNESYYTDELWYPSDLAFGIGEWPSGSYNLYATVADKDQRAFGVAISDSFNVTP